MSLFALAAGNLVAEPQRRDGAKGPFATALLRVATEDGATLVSVIAFGDQGERLLELAKGDAVSVSGRAKLSSWSGKDGAEKHGLSIVAAEIAAARPSRRAASRNAYDRRPTGVGPVRPDSVPMANNPVGDLWPG